MNTSLRTKIKSIDSQFFNGRLKKLNRIRWKYQLYLTQKPYIKKISNNFTNKIDINFQQRKKNFLGYLFDKYGSARCHCPSEKNECIPTGCYYHIYDLLFSLHKDKVKILLECGIGSKKTTIPYNMSTIQSIPGGGYVHGEITFLMQKLLV